MAVRWPVQQASLSSRIGELHDRLDLLALYATTVAGRLKPRLPTPVAAQKRRDRLESPAHWRHRERDFRIAQIAFRMPESRAGVGFGLGVAPHGDELLFVDQ